MDVSREAGLEPSAPCCHKQLEDVHAYLSLLEYSVGAEWILNSAAWRIGGQLRGYCGDPGESEAQGPLEKSCMSYN